VLPYCVSKIKQSSGDRGDRDAFQPGPIVGMQIPNQVDGDAEPPTVIAPPSCHIDQAAMVRSYPPQCCGALVTEDGVTAAR
jgi:hypothetical protein